MRNHILFFTNTKLSLSNLRKYGISLDPAEERMRSESVTNGTRLGGDGISWVQDKTEQQTRPVSRTTRLMVDRQENDLIFYVQFFVAI